MIRDGELIQGECYYLVLYYDDELRFPEIKSLIYAGCDEGSDEGGIRKWIFQDIESFLKHGAAKVGSSDKKFVIYRLDADTLSAVHTQRGLIEELARRGAKD